MTHLNLIFADAHYTVEQSSEHSIPGYLILKPTHSADSIAAMTKEALRSLGPVLALSYACIESVVNPEVIYCARFGEKVRAIHFHIFPRSKYIGDAYRKAHGLNENADISGPRLLDWIMNNKIQLAISKDVDITIKLLKDKFQAMQNSFRSSNF